MTKQFETHTGAAEGRFDGIKRDYSMADVERLSGSVPIEYSLARNGANKLWNLLHTEDYVHSLGAMTGNQAMQMVRAGLKAIYLSGWQVAADANTAGGMYPDQSLYPADSGPELARQINRTLQRCDQIQKLEGEGDIDWFAPIVADAEAGFGGALNAFELTRNYIEAGAAGVHFEDQLASEKKCGHMGGKVLIPVQQHIANLNAARLAADTAGVPTMIVARTDAESAKLITSDVDERDRPFLTGERTEEGFFGSTPRILSSAASCAASPSPNMQICCGWKPRPPTSNRRSVSPRPSTAGSRTRCLPTTVRRASTGRPTCRRKTSRASSVRSAPWATSTSSSPWPASIR